MPSMTLVIWRGMNFSMSFSSLRSTSSMLEPLCPVVFMIRSIATSMSLTPSSRLAFTMVLYFCSICLAGVAASSACWMWRQ